MKKLLFILTLFSTVLLLSCTQPESSEEKEDNTDVEYLEKVYDFLLNFEGKSEDNDTISFTNLNKTIQKAEDGQKYITCSITYNNVSKQAVEAFSGTNLFSDKFSGTIDNARIYYWYKTNEVAYLINIKNSYYTDMIDYFDLSKSYNDLQAYIYFYPTFEGNSQIKMFYKADNSDYAIPIVYKRSSN